MPMPPMPPMPPIVPGAYRIRHIIRSIARMATLILAPAERAELPPSAAARLIAEPTAPTAPSRPGIGNILVLAESSALNCAIWVGRPPMPLLCPTSAAPADRQHQHRQTPPSTLRIARLLRSPTAGHRALLRDIYPRLAAASFESHHHHWRRFN
jgi:hypothetical protein